MSDDMEEMKARVLETHRAVFGDPATPDRPGMLATLNNVRREQQHTTSIITRLAWMLVAGVIAAVLALVIRAPAA